MTADKMFEELGYKKDIDENGNIVYFKFKKYMLENDKVILIKFYVKDKEFINGIIGMQELQAINQKCKELGWI